MRTWEIQLRSEFQGDTLVGHAAVFGAVAEMGDKLETIGPRAFDRAISEGQDVRFTVGHDKHLTLARTKSGTLAFSVDKVGLHFRAELSDTSAGRDLRTSISRGDLDSMSFAFIPRADSWEKRDGRAVNVIDDLDLYDVSVVGAAAYPGTSVQLRSLDSFPRSGVPVRLIRARARLLLTGA